MLGHASPVYPLFKTCLTLLSLQLPLHTFHDHRSTLLPSNPTMICTSIFRNSQWVAAAPPHRRPSPVIFAVGFRCGYSKVWRKVGSGTKKHWMVD
ncbi:hypothetical protein DFP72DRAFT_49773 [Ephemerocybe angulata]|uniref:Uncharacterized protein n=1 Tax=Ephemerocybe angulata TaxID=980116 RepID=A0A8H6HEE7_9AGAR|nr:hypothetical protein DFP72DRAFT_49773 [Tulosesus angulatus]